MLYNALSKILPRNILDVSLTSVCSLIHSINRYLPNAYSVPGTILDARGVRRKQSNKHTLPS